MDPSFRPSRDRERASLDRKFVASPSVAYIYIRIKLVMPCFCTVLCTWKCRFKSLPIKAGGNVCRNKRSVGSWSETRSAAASRHPPSSSFVLPSLPFPFFFLPPPPEEVWWRRFEPRPSSFKSACLGTKKKKRKKKNNCVFIFAEQIKELTCNYVFFLIALQ